MTDKKLRYKRYDINDSYNQQYFKVSGLYEEPYSNGLHCFYLYTKSKNLKANSDVEVELVDQDEQPIKIFTILTDSQSYSPAVTIGFQIEPDYVSLNQTSSLITDGINTRNFGASDGYALLTILGTSSENKVVLSQKELFIKKTHVNCDKLRFNVAPLSSDININFEEFDFENEQIKCSCSLNNIDVMSGYLDAIKIFGKFSNENDNAYEENVHHKEIYTSSTGLNSENMNFSFNLPLNLAYANYDLKLLFYNPLEEPARNVDGNIYACIKEFNANQSIIEPFLYKYLEDFNLTSSFADDAYTLSWQFGCLTGVGGSNIQQWRNIEGKFIYTGENSLLNYSYVWVYGFPELEHGIVCGVPTKRPCNLISHSVGTAEIMYPTPIINSIAHQYYYNTSKYNDNYLSSPLVSLLLSQFGNWLIYPKAVKYNDFLTITKSELDNLFLTIKGYIPTEYRFIVYSRNPNYF